MDLQFILGLLGIAGNFLSNLTGNKTVSTIDAEITTIDAATLAVLQMNAQIKGAAVDWTNPTAVSEFVATLPVFTPIAAPTQNTDPSTPLTKPSK